MTMKHIILLFSLLVLSIAPHYAFAQNDNEIVKDTVIQVPGINAEQIHSALRLWFVESAKTDSRNILQVDNTEMMQGKVTHGIVFNKLNLSSLSGYVEAVLDIRIKNEKFRVRMYNFYHKSTHPEYSDRATIGYIPKVAPKYTGLKGKFYNPFYEKIYPLIDNWFNGNITGMKITVSNSKKIDDDNW